MKAHQRLIREREAALEPRDTASLIGCEVIRVDRDFARDIILRYEWLGTLNNVAVAYYGLVDPLGTPLGVSCFGLGSGTKSRDVCGDAWAKRTIILERGACVHFAHPHAGSFLTSAAVRMCAADFGYRVFLAYSDPAAGEIGTIYQACNWLYLGASNGRPANSWRWEGRRIGTTAWINSRSLRNHARAEGYADTSLWWPVARASGAWEFRRAYDRARYVTFQGTKAEKKEARAALRYPVQEYPKRQLEPVDTLDWT